MFLCVCVCFPMWFFPAAVSSQMSFVSPVSPQGNWHSCLIIKKGKLLDCSDGIRIPEDYVSYTVTEQWHVAVWLWKTDPEGSRVSGMAVGGAWGSNVNFMDFHWHCVYPLNGFQPLNLIPNSPARRSLGLGKGQLVAKNRTWTWIMLELITS